MASKVKNSSKVQSLSFLKYFSPSQIESDQKDLIIAQLKAEVYELSKNEQNCSSLIQQIQTLEHKYQSVQEEKVLNHEFKTISAIFNRENSKKILGLNMKTQSKKSGA